VRRNPLCVKGVGKKRKSGRRGENGALTAEKKKRDWIAAMFSPVSRRGGENRGCRYTRRKGGRGNPGAQRVGQDKSVQNRGREEKNNPAKGGKKGESSKNLLCGKT